MVTSVDATANAGVDLREIAQRAARVRLVVSDVDGVLTDGGVYYSERGEEMKRFSVRDGMGVERLRNDGIETALLTRELAPSVARRAEKLRIRLVYLGVPDKHLFLPRILDDAEVTLDEIAYIGDDVNDADVMRAVSERGLVGAPADARPEVRRLAHVTSVSAGGHGAFRDFAEWIIEQRRAAVRSLGNPGTVPEPSRDGLGRAEPVLPQRDRAAAPADSVFPILQGGKP